jgi:hypothetical protein
MIPGQQARFDGVFNQAYQGLAIGFFDNVFSMGVDRPDAKI